MSELAGPGSLDAPREVAGNASARVLSAAWPIGAVAAVLYGSLLPFDIDWTDLLSAGSIGLSKFAIGGGTREDILTNLLVYVPIGLAVALCGRRGCRPRWTRVLLAVLVGLTVSLVAETLQTAMAQRVASWTDVALNALGAAVGALAGTGFYRVGLTTARRLNRAIADRPFMVMSSSLMIGLFLYSLAPFDIVTNTSALHASFGRARWDLTGARPISAFDPPYARMIGQLSTAVWFSVSGCLAALSAREARRTHTEAFLSAVKHTFVIASLIEFMQLFIVSHSFDVAAIVLNSLAAVFGAWYAMTVVVHRGDPIRQRGVRAVIPTPVLVGLAAFQISAVFLSSFNPDLLSAQALDFGHVRWLPFEALWHRPMTAAVAEVLATLTTYVVLAATLVLLAHRLRLASIRPLAGALVIFVALGAEAMQATTVLQTPDLTTPILAVVALIGVLWLTPTLLDDSHTTPTAVAPDTAARLLR